MFVFILTLILPSFFFAILNERDTDRRRQKEKPRPRSRLNRCAPPEALPDLTASINFMVKALHDSILRCDAQADQHIVSLFMGMITYMNLNFSKYNATFGGGTRVIPD